MAAQKSGYELSKRVLFKGEGEIGLQSWLVGDFNNSNTAAGRRKFYYGWIILLACFVIGVIGVGMRASFGVFFISLEDAFGLTRASTSGVFSVHVLFALVFAILGGWALDRYGPRKVVIIMGFFTGLSMLLTSQAGVLWHLFVFYSLILAIGTGASFPVLIAIVSRWFSKRRGLAVGVITAGFSIAVVVMAPLATYLISAYDWRTSYLVMAFFGFLIVIPLAMLLKKSPDEVAASPEGRKLEATNISSTERRGHNEQGGFSLFQAAKTRNLWVLFFMWVLNGGSFYTLMTHIVPHVIDLGMSSAMAASVLSLIGGSSTVGSLLMGRLSDNIGRKKTMVSCSLLMAGAMVWLIWSQDLWMLYLFAAVFGFAFGGFTAPLSAIPGDSFGLRHLGKIAGVMEAGWMLGGAFGPVFAGYIFDVRGSYFYAFLAGAIAALASAVLILLFKATKR